MIRRKTRRRLTRRWRRLRIDLQMDFGRSAAISFECAAHFVSCKTQFGCRVPLFEPPDRQIHIHTQTENKHRPFCYNWMILRTSLIATSSLIRFMLLHQRSCNSNFNYINAPGRLLTIFLLSSSCSRSGFHHKHWWVGVFVAHDVLVVDCVAYFSICYLI